MNGLLEIYGEYHEAIHGYLAMLTLCSERAFILFFMFPPTADGVLQGVARNGVVLLFSSFIAYGQPASLFESMSGLMFVETFVREAIIGLALGFSASIVFWVAESAGTYIDDLTGYNNIQITNPVRSEQNTPTGTLLMQIATVAFWTLGGMPALLGVLYDSYNWWPLTSRTPVAENILQSFVLHQTDTLMQMTAKLATPIMFILLLVDLAFGFVAKSAQKLEVMQLSQPVKGALTVLILALFVGIFVEQVRGQLVLAGLGDYMRELAHGLR
ncbi:type III secretion apparatus protein SctT (plasmid) [Mycetohabitans rhizoxinica HKI 454]|uniref:Type III secretion apparatus protein SctT n=2 Tax=Mycetohabitans rhizoxinica TaxID=412963 RepID=E5AVH7_MYCRK|nr:MULTISPECIES: type III secretion system export apparatus subunit SctT [Mycetohabitans]MCG1047065.1 type III secretion system export apparatus subunit SctT [Mycetohabitans sp. B6]CBK52130.1 type III secretion apparatus protein SctT [Mycetohabitans rhizoxinica HKI 454]CBW77101.1 type III secretion apparatus protein SctT [Mycetohabitans rhizoxinica HKI 454]